MATPESTQQDQDEFAQGFNEEQTGPTQESEEEQFASEPAPEDLEVMGEAAEGVNSVEEAASEGEAPGDGQSDAGGEGAPSITIAVEPGADSNSNEMHEDPKDLQRQKSWEGRLKAKEAELKAREDALSGREASGAEPGESAAHEAMEAPSAEVVEEVAAQVESGEITADEAMRTLTADFGDDFTKMLSVLISAKASEIAGQAADERVGKVTEKMDSIVSDIEGAKAKEHFLSIADNHPDFMEIAESPEFKDYIDAMEPDQKAAAMETIETGSSRDIVKLLTSYKDSVKPGEEQDPVDEEALNNAEGVRSGGLKLPTKPEVSQDYEEAWDKF